MTKSPTLNITIAPSTNTCPFGITGAIDKSSITVGDTATITGKVWNGAGQPIPNIRLSLMAIDYTTGVQLQLTTGQTDASGNYSISYQFGTEAKLALFVTTQPSSDPTCANFGPISTSQISLTVSPPTTGPNALILTQAPVQSGSILSVVYKNATSAPISAVVVADIRNSIGQTLATTTATLTNIPPGGTSGASLNLLGPAPGTYTVLFFAVTPTGIVLSAETQVSVSL